MLNLNTRFKPTKTMITISAKFRYYFHCMKSFSTIPKPVLKRSVATVSVEPEPKPMQFSLFYVVVSVLSLSAGTSFAFSRIV